MAADHFQINLLERLRRQKSRFGAATLTLILAGWLNLLVQPCLMAAPIDHCHDSVMDHHAALVSGSAVALSGQGGIDSFAAAHCQSMEHCVCAERGRSHPAISPLDPENKFIPSFVFPAQLHPGPVTFYLPAITPKPSSSRVSLFIQNCAFLV